jgi:uncharacterized protein (TIGR02594 family)
MKYWESVFKMIGSKQAELQKEVFRNTCWWDEVSQKSKDFLPTPNVYHWHPVAFVENMREMNKEPEWIVIAKGEIGQKEIKGDKDNLRIVEYHATTTLKATDDEVAWCSSFVNWCFRQCGIDGTGSARALPWEKWGKKYDSPPYGSVAVIAYENDGTNKRNGSGHVGFVVGKKGNRIIVLGGNQSDSVRLNAYDPNSIIVKNLKWKGMVVAYVLPENEIAQFELPVPEGEIDELGDTR